MGCKESKQETITQNEDGQNEENKDELNGHTNTAIENVENGDINEEALNYNKNKENGEVNEAIEENEMADIKEETTNDEDDKQAEEQTEKQDDDDDNGKDDEGTSDDKNEEAEEENNAAEDGENENTDDKDDGGVGETSEEPTPDIPGDEDTKEIIVATEEEDTESKFGTNIVLGGMSKGHEAKKTEEIEEE